MSARLYRQAQTKRGGNSSLNELTQKNREGGKKTRVQVEPGVIGTVATLAAAGRIVAH